MELSEVIELEGIKLLDTNTIGLRKKSFLIFLYDCRAGIEIPLERVEEETELLRQGIEYLLKNNIFSIEEVAEEKQFFLQGLNESLKYFLRYEYKLPSFLKKARYRNKLIEKRRKELIILSKEKDRKSEKNKINYLNAFCKKLVKVIREVRNKDIRETFSNEEQEAYNKSLSSIIGLCKTHGLKTDFSERYEHLKSHHPCNFQTDEKLISTALTLASRQPVILISSDRHIKDILQHCTDKHIKFDISHKLFLYSDFNKGYGLKLTYPRNLA